MIFRHHLPAIILAIRAFIALTFQKFSFEAPPGDVFSCNVIIDFQNCGLENVPRDFSLIWILLRVAETMPMRVAKVLLHELPWTCAPIVKAMVMLTPSPLRERVHVTSNSNICKHVSKDNLPDFIARGRSKVNYHSAPEHCLEFGKGFEYFVSDPKSRSKAMKAFERYMDEEGIAFKRPQIDRQLNEIVNQNC